MADGGKPLVCEVLLDRVVVECTWTDKRAGYIECSEDTWVEWSHKFEDGLTFSDEEGYALPDDWQAEARKLLRAPIDAAIAACKGDE
jgi:hypothetical protein